MSFLVDKNVFSELAARKPNEQVLAWLRTHESEFYISTITIAEIRRGIEALLDGRRKVQLREWLIDLCDCMKGRVLSFNTSAVHVGSSLRPAGIVREYRLRRSTARSPRSLADTR